MLLILYFQFGGLERIDKCHAFKVDKSNYEEALFKLIRLNKLGEEIDAKLSSLPISGENSKKSKLSAKPFLSEKK